MMSQVIVVGLGAMGAAALYQLAKAGIAAIGIDARPVPHAFGSSHGETRITRCAVGEGEEYAPLAIASHRAWRELEQLTGLDLFLQCGCLIISRAEGAALHHGKPDFVTRTIASAREAGIPHEALEEGDIRRRFSQLGEVEGARACYEPGAGLVYPERCIEAQIRAARAAGASVRWGIVTSVAQRRDAAVVIVDGKELDADQVIVAAGPWSGRLLGAPFNTLLSVFPQTLHWFPADAVTFGPDRFPTIIWIHGDRERDYFYCFPVLAGSGNSRRQPSSISRRSIPTTSRERSVPSSRRPCIGITSRGGLSASCQTRSARRDAFTP